MAVLEAGPLSKKELAERLGLDQITGHLNRAVKRLVTSGRLRYTIPDKPIPVSRSMKQSRMRRFFKRLCEKRRAVFIR